MSNVPMTRPDEMLAMHESPPTGYYAQLEDGRILSVGSDGMFRTSEDAGFRGPSRLNAETPTETPSAPVPRRW